MNERIKQLAEQAELTKGVWKTPDFILEKFAELIVRECIDSILDSSVEYTTRPQVASEIREHFGVEQ